MPTSAAANVDSSPGIFLLTAERFTLLRWRMAERFSLPAASECVSPWVEERTLALQVQLWRALVEAPP